MTIQQLLEMPVGERTGGGFVLQVAITHKIAEYKVDEQPWWRHEVTLTDGKDKMRAFVVIANRRKFVKRDEIKVIVCEIMAESKGGYGKMLLIHEHERITYTPDQLDEPRVIEQQTMNNKWNTINRGKVKHGQVVAAIEAGWIHLDPISQTVKARTTDSTKNERVRHEIVKWTDWVMSPEDKWDG